MEKLLEKIIGVLTLLRYETKVTKYVKIYLQK